MSIKIRVNESGCCPGRLRLHIGEYRAVCIDRLEARALRNQLSAGLLWMAGSDSGHPRTPRVVRKSHQRAPRGLRPGDKRRFQTKRTQEGSRRRD